MSNAQPKLKQTVSDVILVEDDSDLRISLTEYLVLSGFGVTSVGSAMEFYARLAEKPHAIAIIDLGLPDQSGYVLIEYARKNTNMSIIVITANDSVDTRIKSYQQGGDLYLAKPVNNRELAAAISTLARRNVGRVAESLSPEMPDITINKHWVLAQQSWQLISPANHVYHLTSRERSLLLLLTQQPGQVVERIRLLKDLYGRQDDSSQRALDSLVRRLRAKIDTNKVEQPIMTVYAVGYSFASAIHFL